MRIEISKTMPPEFTSAKPIRTYETKYVYTGFRRYDIDRKMLMEFVETPTGLIMQEIPIVTDVFSKGYSVENASVTVYSEKPRIWKEVLNPFVTHFFREIQEQPCSTASTA